MFKKKKKEKLSNELSLGEDLPLIKLPFDLYTAFSTVVEELKNKKFHYQGSIIKDESVLNFKSKEREENLTVTVTKENLLIKQFTMEGNHEKLKVIYVIKPSNRDFKIL